MWNRCNAPGGLPCQNTPDLVLVLVLVLVWYVAGANFGYRRDGFVATNLSSYYAPKKPATPSGSCVHLEMAIQVFNNI